jgi:hypothetical protein
MEKAKPVARSDALSNRELALIADSLATAADEFADRSCNDFSFPANSENRAIGEAIARHRGPGDWGTDHTLAAFLSQIAQRGLTNPPLEHPLMSTPLGALPEVTEFYTDELLEGVVKQARLEFQDL